jgi:SpoVK/Ycf46/Vps4 family AAA+-type ATPase
MTPILPGGIVSVVQERRPLSDLVLPDKTRAVLDRVLAENQQAALLESRGLRAGNRLLFYGPPGCGKTVAAGGIALALDMPLATAPLDKLLESYLGSTGRNLREVFDLAKNQRVVLLLDEVDAIGRSRSSDSGDLAEMKRVVNSFLTMLEEHRGPSVIIAATNHESALDPALWRRFDEVAVFTKPSGAEAADLLLRLLARHEHQPLLQDWPRQLRGMSFADVERVAFDAMKIVVMNPDVGISVALMASLRKQRERAAGASPKKGRKS